MNKLDTIIDIEFLKEYDVCREGIEYFEKEIKEPISARELIEKLLATEELEKIKWVNWLLAQLLDREQALGYAIFSTEQVLPIFEKKYPEDRRPHEAIEAVKQVTLNDTAENRKIAKKAAYAAANAAYAAYAAANAAYAAYAADEAANAADEAANAADEAANAANVAYAAAYAANAAYAAGAAGAAAYAADEAAYAAYAAASAANAAAYAANTAYAAASAAMAAGAAASAAMAAGAAYAAYEAAYEAAYATTDAARKEILLTIINYGIELLNQTNNEVKI